MSDCSILVCSCDKYEDAWNPFFTLFKKNWEDCPYPVYLNTETKKYNGIDGLSVKSIHCNPKYSWSKRLKNSLKHIQSEFVLLMLEDFFFLSEVNQKKLDDVILWMKSGEIASVCFERYGRRKEEIVEHGCFIKRSRGARYTFSLQAGIWKRDILIKCLTNFETPWEFEEIGNIRSCKIKEKFYVQLQDSAPVFDYNVFRDTGYGLYRGKWLKSNIELFEKNGIEVDFENLGFFESINQFKDPPKRSGKEKIFFYAKHPIAFFKIIRSIAFLLFKKCYWCIEKLLYSHLVEN